ncbi:MAG: maleylpyruvate isomerase N-terminal domain-containing protein [Egibacteraceae bacterium]
MRKASVVAALRSQRAATLTRLAALPDHSWDATCLPGWRVRDVAAHLVAMDEASVTGRLIPAVRGARDRQEFERWNDVGLASWSERSPFELLDALERWGERLARLAGRLPSAALRVPVSGWYGRQPLLFLLYRRVLDEWVHECDVAWMAGSRAEPAAAGSEVSDVLAAAVLSTLPHLGLPRTPRTSGVARLVVHVGEDHWQTWGVDFARRQYGARVTARPDVVVRTDACTLALLMEDRWSWSRVPRDRLSMDGDELVASDLLDAIAPAP